MMSRRNLIAIIQIAFYDSKQVCFTSLAHEYIVMFGEGYHICYRKGRGEKQLCDYSRIFMDKGLE